MIVPWPLLERSLPRAWPYGLLATDIGYLACGNLCGCRDALHNGKISGYISLILVVDLIVFKLTYQLWTLVQARGLFNETGDSDTITLRSEVAYPESNLVGPCR